MNGVLNSFMALLEGISVPVYRIDAPLSETGNYVIVRPESGTGNNNKRSINDNVIVITDITTVFENNVDGSVVEGIDDEIFSRLMPTPQSHSLTDPSGEQILNVTRESFNYLPETDGVKNYYRKVSRYSIQINQTA